MSTMFDMSNVYDGTIDPDALFNYDAASISSTDPAFSHEFLSSLHQQRGSISSNDGMQPYLSSSTPSLSPASQLQVPHSPHSSSSPRSVFSNSGTDESFMHNYSTSSAFDQLFSLNPEVQAKPAQPFAFPIADFDPDFQFNFELFNAVNQATQQGIRGQVAPADQWHVPGVNAMHGFPAATETKPTPKGKVAARPAPRRNKSDSPEERPVGKHNKTERRYRQKVQAAQSDLRDSVPALRVLYGTSTEEQKNTTDFRAEDGSVDGLGEFNRPNASAKTTIFLGARLYIELLQRRVDTLNRKVSELESFRLAVSGQEHLLQWREDFANREAVHQAELAAKKREEDSYDEDESEEEEPKRKKPRATKAKDLRAFAAFAVSFGFLPSMSTVFPTSTSPVSYTYQSATTGQVLQRLPLITAEHTSRLLSRALPAAAVPTPLFLLDWTWRLLLAVCAAWTVKSFLHRRDRAQRYTVPAGNSALLIKDAVGALSGRRTERTHSSDWIRFAADVVGGVTTIDSVARYHLSLRLDAIAADAHTLALLALVQPTLPLLRSPIDVWAAAKAAITPETPIALRHVLALHFDEAKRAVQLLPPTPAPITAIAEQVTLVHLNDLFSRFFVQLIDGATSGGQEVPRSVKALLANLESRSVGNNLRSSLFDKEIRGVVAGVPKGTAAHALGLVLIGLWGLMAGPTASAQAALASALAAEEVKGVGSALASVGALRELLYPDSGMVEPVVATLPANAVSIDKLALVCIQFIRLLATTTAVADTRLDRLADSRKVQKATSQIRLVLTQTTFAGLDDDVEVKSFDEAREKLVTVLSTVGRRAAGRASGRDEDSGLEGDIDDL